MPFHAGVTDSPNTRRLGDSDLVGDPAMKRMVWEHYRSYLVPTEVEPDGSCPREEARTQSLSYSAMNLDAFAVLCRIAEVNGVSL